MYIHIYRGVGAGLFELLVIVVYCWWTRPYEYLNGAGAGLFELLVIVVYCWWTRPYEYLNGAGAGLFELLVIVVYGWWTRPYESLNGWFGFLTVQKFNIHVKYTAKLAQS